MSNKQICIRVCLNFSTNPSSNLETKIFRYNDQNDTVEISPHELRQLLLSNGSNVSVETSFGDGHETRDAVRLMDVLGDARSTLYARREHSTDKGALPGCVDVVLYRDQKAKEELERYFWWRSSGCPCPGDSTFVYNGSTYYLIWLTDEPGVIPVTR